MKQFIDSIGRVHNYLRISLTERCNLRCLYCMPSEGVPLQPDSHILTRHEIETLARSFVDNGVNKIRLTGGEPTVRKDFMEIVESLGKIRGVDQLAITTNGLTLPRKAMKLRELGLTGVNISLDTLVEAKFNFFTRRQGLSRVLDAIHSSLRAGIPNVKVNCVVMRGQNDDELVDFVAMTRDLPLQVRFIEYMPFDGNKWQRRKMMPYFDMISTLNQSGYELVRREHEHGETSKNYSVLGSDGKKHMGSVGFITSMTSNFCGTCNRLRITADGNLKVCLFGNEEVSLRDMLRNGAKQEEIEAIVNMALYNKKAEHEAMDTLKDSKNRPMILIGGTQNLLASQSSARHNPYHLAPERFAGHFRVDSKRRAAQFARCYSTGPKLTHVDEDGSAHMVDVGDKSVTKRKATAAGRINFTHDSVAKQIETNSNKKGDVLGVARVAGIMAAKQTSSLIPLCHPLSITKIKNSLTLDGSGVNVELTVECEGKTGVEMEALVGASITLNTVYDMCKAVDKHMEITGLRVVEKQGGRNDFKSSS